MYACGGGSGICEGGMGDTEEVERGRSGRSDVDSVFMYDVPKASEVIN